MDKLPKDKILLYNNDTLETMRRTFELDKPGAMENAITILEKWVKEQRHFTKKNFERRCLENLIISSKGSVERAKLRLDRTCTFRTLKPELFCNYNIKDIFNNHLKYVTHALLPKMTKTHERVYLMKCFGQTFPSNVTAHFVCIVPYYVEYMRRNDYPSSYCVVLDFMDTNLMDFIPKLNINDLYDLVEYILNSYGFRVKAIYLISSSKLIEIGVAITKQLLSAKLGERVHVLKTRESLKSVIEEDILPEEYGGNGGSLDKLHKQWLDVLSAEEHVELVMKETKFFKSFIIRLASFYTTLL